jgi:RNA polymerase sigma factor (sigma-70 family)
MPLTAPDPLIVPPEHCLGEDRHTPEDVGKLFREHNQTLVRFLNARLGSEQEAKEIAQEAYVKLLQLERRGAISFMRAYLFRIAANLAIDRLRQRKSQGPHEDIELFEELEDDDEQPERTVIATEQIEHIVRYMEELPERCAEAFVLHRFHGLRPTEVAAAMKISDRRVRSHLVRALMYCKLRMDGVAMYEALSRTRE